MERTLISAEFSHAADISLVAWRAGKQSQQALWAWQKKKKKRNKQPKKLPPYKIIWNQTFHVPEKIAAGVAIWRTPQNQLIVIRPGCLKWNCKWTHSEDATNADEHRGDRTWKMHQARSHSPSPRFPSSLGLLFFLRCPLSLLLSPRADAFKDL